MYTSCKILLAELVSELLKRLRLSRISHLFPTVKYFFVFFFFQRQNKETFVQNTDKRFQINFVCA